MNDSLEKHPGPVISISGPGRWRLVKDYTEPFFSFLVSKSFEDRSRGPWFVRMLTAPTGSLFVAALFREHIYRCGWIYQEDEERNFRRVEMDRSTADALFLELARRSNPERGRMMIRIACWLVMLFGRSQWKEATQ